jgi:hypothetical protein
MKQFIRAVAVISLIFGFLGFLALLLNHKHGTEDILLLVASSILFGSSLITLALLEQNK